MFIIIIIIIIVFIIFWFTFSQSCSNLVWRIWHNLLPKDHQCACNNNKNNKYSIHIITHSLPLFSLSSSLCLSWYWILDCAELPLYGVNGDVPVREEEKGTLRVSSYHFRVLVYEPLVIHGIDGINRRGLGPNIESLRGAGRERYRKKKIIFGFKNTTSRYHPLILTLHKLTARKLSSASNAGPPTKFNVGPKTCGASGSENASFTWSLNFSAVPRLKK